MNSEVDTGKTESNNEVTVDEMQNIADSMKPKEWKTLGRFLGLKDTTLEQIKGDHHIHGIIETSYQMLNKWKEAEGSRATKETLIEGLKKIGRQDIIGQVFHNGLPRSSLDRSIKFNIGDDIKITVTNISEKQKKRYINIGMPYLSWVKRVSTLKDLYVDLSLISKGTLGEEEKQKIKLESIFDGIEEYKTNRIYVEAGPGFGKTTLASKLLFDWANGKEYIANRYKLVFIISLREYQGNIDKFLKKQMEIERVSEEETMNILAAIQLHCLLILDGYDELNDKLKPTLDSVLKCDMYSLMTVLMTSRPGHYKLFEKNGKAFENVTIWSKYIYIEGIPVEKRNNFIQKYVQVDGTELFEKIDRLSKNELTDLYQCPLFLILIATLLQDEQEEEITSKTDLYKKVFNFILKRSIEKGCNVTPNTKFKGRFLTTLSSFDVFLKINNHSRFHFMLKPDDYLHKLVIKLGKYSLSLLKENRLVFSESEILAFFDNNRNILNLGFFISNNKYCFDNESSFEPVHKTFIEFLTAVYLKKLFLKSKQKFSSQIVSILGCGLEPNRYSLLFSFLVGLLGDKADVLFQVLNQKCLLHSVTLDNIFKEMVQTKELIYKFVDFLPEYYVVGRDDDPFLSVGLNLGRIKVVEYHMNYSLKLEKGTKVGILILCNDLINDKGLNSIPNLRLSCDKLIVRYKSTSLYPYGIQLLKQFDVCKGIYISIPADRQALETIFKSDNALKINHLFISYDGNISSYSECLRELISRNHVVENLILFKGDGTDRLKKYNDENHLNYCNYCRDKTEKLPIEEMSFPLFESPCSIPKNDHSCLFVRGPKITHIRIWKCAFFVKDLMTNADLNTDNIFSRMCVYSDKENSSNPTSDFIQLIRSLSNESYDFRFPVDENPLQQSLHGQSQGQIFISNPFQKMMSLKCNIDFLQNLFEFIPDYWKPETLTILDLICLPESYINKLCEGLPNLKCIAFAYDTMIFNNSSLWKFIYLKTVRLRFYKSEKFIDFLQDLRNWNTSRKFCSKQLHLQFISKTSLVAHLICDICYSCRAFSGFLKDRYVDQICIISQHENDLILFSNEINKDKTLSFKMEDDNLSLFNLDAFDMNLIQMKKLTVIGLKTIRTCSINFRQLST